MDDDDWRQEARLRFWFGFVEGVGNVAGAVLVFAVLAMLIWGL